MGKHINTLQLDIDNGTVCNIMLFASLIVAISFYVFNHIINGWLLYGGVVLSVTLLGYLLVNILSMIPISISLAIVSGIWAYLINLKIFALSQWLVITIVSIIAFLVGLIIGRKKHLYHDKVTETRTNHASNIGLVEKGMNLFGIPTFGLGELAGTVLDEMDGGKITRSFDFHSWPLKELIIPSLVGALIGCFVGLFNPNNLAFRYALVSIGSAIGCSIGTVIQASDHGGGSSIIGTFATFRRGIFLGAIITSYIAMYQGYWI